MKVSKPASHASRPTVSSPTAAEKQRWEVLREYQIVDTPAEKEWDDLTRLAAYVAGTPIAFIGFADGQRQWYKSKVGLSVTEMPLAEVCCRYTIQGTEMLEISVIGLDARLTHDFFVGEGSIRYYGGLPLVTPKGHIIGTLCVCDQVPRKLTPEQKEALGVLAGEIINRLESFRNQRQLTEQHRQLALSEERYQTLFEQCGTYLFTHTPEGKIHSVNPAVTSALGYSREQLVGQSIARLLNYIEPDLLAMYLREVLAGPPVTGITKVRTASGEARYWQYRCFASRLACGTRIITGSAQDVTEKEVWVKIMRKTKDKLEDQVLIRTRELQRTNHSLSLAKAELATFLYRASHDLQGPICSLEGLLQLAGAEPNPSQQIQYIPLMQLTVGKLKRVVKNLLNYSRNSSNHLAIEPVSFEVLIKTAWQSCHSLKGFDRVAIKLHIQAPTPFFSDPYRLKVVLKNVLSNSIVFQNWSLAQPSLTVRINCTDENATILIQDNGIGVKEEDHTRVFDMFTRSSLQSCGSGLGLFVAREIIRKLGGSIHLQSHEGKGTLITILVPNLQPWQYQTKEDSL